MKNRFFTRKFVLVPKFAGIGRMEFSVKNRFFTRKFVLAPKFASIGRMEFSVKNRFFTRKFVLVPKFAGIGRMEFSVKNRFFTRKFVLAPKFAGIGRMEFVMDLELLPQKEILLQVRNLSFSYTEEGRAGSYALQDVTVKFCSGEKIAVLGPNGAGKSTFFLNLNGVREPDRGEILFHGEKIERKTRDRLRKGVGIVFQDADSQMIGTTVKAEVAFGPLNLKLPKEEVESRTKNAITRLGLQALSERPPHDLSGGEKKLVTIADILAMEPEIIIMDEPTASLDPLHEDMLEGILVELWKEGKTILLSTHDVDFAYRFADRVLIFSEGKLIADGNARDIFNEESLLRTANLKKPAIMKFYDMLTAKKLIGKHTGKDTYPKTLRELQELL